MGIEPAGPIALVYDGACWWCENFKNFVVRADHGRRIEPIPFGDPRVAAMLPRLTRDRIEGSFHLVWGDGRVKSGHEALPDVLRLFPGGRMPAWVMEHGPGMGWVNRWLYQVIATHRPRMKRGREV